MPTKRYDFLFDDTYDDLDIELYCIRAGFPNKIQHFENARKLMWPWLDDHRWHRLCRDNLLTHKVTVLMGCASSGKTHEAAWKGLTQYFADPDNTLVMVSSTDMRGLQLRVFGEIKMLFEKAKELWPNLPGNLVESKLAICTDNVEEDKARDLRKGIIGIPCVQNGKFVGLGKYAGIKQKHVFLIADEAQFMGGSFLSAFANLDKNADFTACVLGNANDPLDPLGKAAEPLDGWSSHLEPTKTDVWKTKFMNGVCVNLIGTDSPNFDFPENEPEHYPYLISREKIKNTLSFFAKDSVEYYSQCIGSMKVGVLDRRVVSRDLVEQFKAKDDVIWSGSDIVKVFALDAAYGGDRCVGGHVEFGKAVDGKIVIRVNQPMIVPVLVRKKEDDPQPEDQIADWIKEYCDRKEISPDNVFHDSTGRGGLGTAIARVFSDRATGIEFGGQPSGRPVSLDLWVYDMKEKKRRLKLCSEHYDRFLSELWFSMRLAVESRQLKHIPEDVLDELYMREWDRVKENKIRVETKSEMRERFGRSCDLGDWLAIAVEGARRKGFQIDKLSNEPEDSEGNEWLRRLGARQRHLTERHALNYSA